LLNKLLIYKNFTGVQILNCQLSAHLLAIPAAATL